MLLQVFLTLSIELEIHHSLGTKIHMVSFSDPIQSGDKTCSVYLKTVYIYTTFLGIGGYRVSSAY